MSDDVEQHLRRLAGRFSIPSGTAADGFVTLAKLALRDANRDALSRGPVRPAEPRLGDVQRTLHWFRSITAAEVETLDQEDPACEMAIACLGWVTGQDLDQFVEEQTPLAKDVAVDEAERRAEQLCRSVGRPSGRTDLRFDMFVSSLYHAIKISGGDPGTCSKYGTDPVKGRFRDELELLVSRGLLMPILPAENSILSAFRLAERRWRDAQ